MKIFFQESEQEHSLLSNILLYWNITYAHTILINNDNTFIIFIKKLI